MSFWSTVMPAGNIPYGKRLIPTLIEEIAQTDPQRVCFSFPLSSELSQGFRDVNFKSFANAINKTAHFIQQEIGRSSMFETIMYIGFPDLRHYIALVALMKTGHKVRPEFEAEPTSVMTGTVRLFLIHVLGSIYFPSK